jgi:hypothetical protein
MEILLEANCVGLTVGSKGALPTTRCATVRRQFPIRHPGTNRNTKTARGGLGECDYDGVPEAI